MFLKEPKELAPIWELTCPVDLIFVDPPHNGEEGRRRRSNRLTLDYMAPVAIIKTQHSGILLPYGI